ncbi:BTB/POZ domain-containing protein kctd1 [Plakobranchus ocellatus]|uniref:BTB/POZ domain-containing protein kctd1 n=1 Tax=Plakobranchus ocellatus TaxID=259542 RepID=A0AAV4B4K2_9GAST|nr:BTB/POZ domain-containing protein kctd1 [Plakobranchus ocellatus]
MSPRSPVGSIFDLSIPPRSSSNTQSKPKGEELLHTVRQTKWAVTKAREWLSLHGMNTTFEDFTDEQLDQMLLGFYTSGVKKDGSSFSATALLAFRTALNRYLQKRGRITNLATAHNFKQSNAVLARLMSTSVKVNKTIRVPDIKLMYTSGTLSNSTPESLLYKVWFELQMNFRSKLDWSKVLAEHFFFSHNSVGKLVVTWNTCGLGNCSQMTVIEADGSSYCPVESLRLYMEHRSQAGKALLQVPASKDLQTKGVWYLPEDIRDYREKSFMKKISALARLSQTYTNACVLNCYEEYFQAMLSLNNMNPSASTSC